MDNARNVESRRRIPLFNAAAARRGGGAGGRRVVSARSMDRMDPGSKESRVDFRSTFSVSFFSICVAARRLSLSLSALFPGFNYSLISGWRYVGRKHV